MYMAGTAAGVGGWELDVTTRRLVWTDVLFHIHELPIGETPSLDSLFSYFPEPDRSTVAQAIHDAVERGVPFDLPLRFLTAKGAKRWVRAICAPQLENERCVRLIGAVLDISKAHHAADALEAAKLAAEGANVAKSRFLANMSHEIRTPLNGMLGMTELLLQTPLSPEQQEYAEVAKSSGEALLDLVSEIMDLTKIESGHLELENVEFDLRSVIDEAVDAVALKAAEKMIDLSVDLQRDPGLVRGDPTRLRQILCNLLGNAVKFTERGEVLLKMSAGSLPDRHALTFEVIDTGIGIAPATIAKLFSVFMQADASTTRRHGGTGLGLAISRMLINAMGGDVRVTSEPGKGSVFSFDITLATVSGISRDGEPHHRLPRVRLLLAAPQGNASRILWTGMETWNLDVSVENTLDDGLARWKAMASSGRMPEFALIDQQLAGGGAELAVAIRELDPLQDCKLLLMRSLAQPVRDRRLYAGVLPKPVRPAALHAMLSDRSAPPGTAGVAEAVKPPAPRWAGCSVLVVDDNAVNLLVAGLQLAKLGFTVTNAGNGPDALARLRADRFSLIFMDCQMSDMDGFDTTRRLRSRNGGALDPSVPVIALTANALSGDRERCLAAGMDECLTKPFDQKRLIAVIERVLPGTADARNGRVAGSRGV